MLQQLVPNSQRRRAVDLSRAPINHASIDSRQERNTLRPLIATGHRDGWVLYNRSRQLPVDASVDMRAGYDEARSNFLSWYTATDEQVVQVKP